VVVEEEEAAPETPPVPELSPENMPAPDAGAAAAPAAAEVTGETGGITLTRQIAGNSYTPGQPLAVELTLTHEGQERVTALAITEDLPENWAFASITGGQAPTVSPPERATGTLNFIWVNVPEFPFTVSYLIDTTEQPGGPAEIKGKAIYRKLGPELQTEEITTALSPVAASATEAPAPVPVVVDETAE
jgi:hypothetical protein